MKIASIKPVTTKKGNPMFIVTSMDGNLSWITFNQWKGASLKANYEYYNEGEILADYYQEGETLLNGEICDTSDLIVKNFQITPSPRLVAMAIAAETALMFDSASDAAAAFKAKKLAEKAQAKPEADEKKKRTVKNP